MTQRANTLPTDEWLMVSHLLHSTDSLVGNKAALKQNRTKKDNSLLHVTIHQVGVMGPARVKIKKGLCSNPSLEGESRAKSGAWRRREGPGWMECREGAALLVGPTIAAPKYWYGSPGLSQQRLIRARRAASHSSGSWLEALSLLAEWNLRLIGRNLIV